MVFFADTGVLVVAAIASAAIVLRFGVIGFVVGVVSIWAAGILRIELLYRIDPQRDTAMLDASWLVILGWIVGVIWCAPFLVGRLLFRWRRGRQKNDHAP